MVPSTSDQKRVDEVWLVVVTVNAESKVSLGPAVKQLQTNLISKDFVTL